MNKTIKALLVFSLLVNIILLIILIPYYIEKRNKKNYFNFDIYKENNISDKGNEKNKIVFIGNSITENWVNLNSYFFSSNNYLNRGVGGQTSSQLLLRFQQDVVELDPAVVVINAGTNDIAQGDGFYDPVYTLKNIKSMVDIAQAHRIEVILTAVLPAEKYKISYFKTVRDVQPLIDNFNKEIRLYAEEEGIPFVDYNTAMRNNRGWLKDNLTFDGVHPDASGYKVMEKLIKSTIDSIMINKIN